MRGIVLAAGRGSRLGGLTGERPKCLVELAGRPLLAWQRAALAAAGITETAVVVGYRGERVDAPGLTVLRAPRWAETNMVGSLLAADAWLSASPCVVSYADIVYSAATVRRLAAADGELAIAYDPDWERLWRRRFADPRDDAETFRRDPDGTLRAIGDRPGTVAEVEGQYMGLLRFTPRAWAAVRSVLDELPPERVDALDMTTLLRLLIGAGERIATVACAGAWGEVDSVTDLAVCEELIAAGALSYEGGTTT
jgi:L-glutamine-phosphate cytidylyltransferase